MPENDKKKTKAICFKKKIVSWKFSSVGILGVFQVTFNIDILLRWVRITQQLRRITQQLTITTQMSGWNIKVKNTLELFCYFLFYIEFTENVLKWYKELPLIF